MGLLANGNQKQTDPRFYIPKANADGHFEAEIKFLPNIDGLGGDVVQETRHYLNGSYHLCVKPLRGTCAICNETYKLYKELGKGDAYKEACKPLWGTDKFITNILVVNDPVSPQNNGKVFLYRMQKCLFDILSDFMDTASSTAISIKGNPFKTDVSHSLILKGNVNKEWKNSIKMDKSTFIPTETPIAQTDEELNRILGERHSMIEWVKSDKLAEMEQGLQTQINMYNNSVTNNVQNYSNASPLANNPLANGVAQVQPQAIPSSPDAQQTQVNNTSALGDAFGGLSTDTSQSPLNSTAQVGGTQSPLETTPSDVTNNTLGGGDAINEDLLKALANK
jgi:hypothetical protein